MFYFPRIRLSDLSISPNLPWSDILTACFRAAFPVAQSGNMPFFSRSEAALETPLSAIVIMGVSGSGKSTLASQLAQRIGWRFVEGDDLHPAGNVAKMSAGLPLTDADRLPWLERVAAELDLTPSPGCIVSCSALRRTYRDFVRMQVSKPVLFIMAEAAPNILLHRLENRPGHYMPPSLLDSQLATLERPDADENAIVIDSSGAPEIVVTKLIDLLKVSTGKTSNRITG